MLINEKIFDHMIYDRVYLFDCCSQATAPKLVVLPYVEDKESNTAKPYIDTPNVS